MNKKMQSLRTKILETLMDNENGLNFYQLWNKVGGKKKDILNLLNDLIETPLVILREDRFVFALK